MIRRLAPIVALTAALLASAARAQPSEESRAALDSLPPVPTAAEYLAMTPMQRYRLRMRIRFTELEARRAWLARFRESAMPPR